MDNKTFSYQEFLKQFSNNQTDVSMVLAKHVISSDAKEKNVVFSPLSIHVVLALIGNTGRSLEQILTYFKCNSINELNASLSELVTKLFAHSSSPVLSCANGVWVDKRLVLDQRFKKIAESMYKAVAEQADFVNQAEKEREKLNAWAEKKTNGLIKEIIPPGWIEDSTMVVFGNALYFKGEWDSKFIKSYTKDYDFFLLNGSSIKAPFITSYEDQYISSFNGFQVLRLPYKQGKDLRRFSMYIFLPDLKNGLSSLVEAFAAKPGFLQHHLPRERVEVDEFRIPKFKICFHLDASNICKELGLTRCSILQKSFIEVNEEGTEAASVTFGGVFSFSSGCPPPPKKMISFVADHPFIFVVREDTTGMLLFVGQVVNPLVE